MKKISFRRFFRNENDYNYNENDCKIKYILTVYSFKIIIVYL